MTGPTEVGLLGDALAVIDEARAYGFAPDAAFSAAASYLESASHVEAILIGSVLAAWIATELNPSVETVDLGGWLEHASSAVIRRAVAR